MRKRICFVVAVPGTAQAFLRDHIAALSKEYDVYLLGNISDARDVETLSLAGWHRVAIERGISIRHDIRAVLQAHKYFRKMRFDAVHSVTPKAGLVCALAGKWAAVRHRTHIFTGQVWATKTGFMRWLLKTIDKMIARLANHILVDGRSQRSFLEREGVLREGQAEVFAQGSISGVNAERFVPNPELRQTIRKEIGIDDKVTCFVFLGRLNHDKGIGELYEAFDRLASETDKAFLLLVGKDEEGYVERAASYKSLEAGRNCFFFGITPEPEKVLNAGDVFVLPTYREGFGTSVLEAACMGIPCICSDAYGVQDAYVAGETGLRCKVGDTDSLYGCMKTMQEHPDIIREMGNKARERALRDFNGDTLTECWVAFYHTILPLDI